MELNTRWFLAFGLVSVAACKTNVEPCHGDLHVGDSFAVEILGKADPALFERPGYNLEGLPSCGDLDPVQIGASFQITLDKHTGTGPGTACYDFFCPTDFPSAAESSPVSVGRPGDILVCYNGQTKLPLSSGCEVQRFVGLTHSDTTQSIYAQPDATGTGPVTLIRALMITTDLSCTEPPMDFPDAASKSGYFCYDQWNVQLTQTGK